MARVVTTYSTVDWSDDGALVTKTRSPAFDARRRFRNELRVNRLLLEEPPPIPTPPMVGHSARTRGLTFAAVAAEPLGPKYPLDLRGEQVDAMVELALRLRSYSPRRRWLRRFNAVRRLHLAHRFGLLTASEAGHLVGLARLVHTRPRFAHGDLTARNVLCEGATLHLIDWEWAGLYPDGYDLAFLWFSVVDVGGGRARVEQHVDGDPRTFLLSALLVQLWHLQWYVPPEFRAKHLVTRDELVARLLGR